MKAAREVLVQSLVLPSWDDALRERAERHTPGFFMASFGTALTLGTALDEFVYLVAPSLRMAQSDRLIVLAATIQVWSLARSYLVI